MTLLFDTAIIIVVAIILIILVKSVDTKKHWTYWERFTSSKEFIPSPPFFEYTPEDKKKVKRLLKLLGVWLLILAVLIVVRIFVLN